MYLFQSDNNSGAHPNIIEIIGQVNSGYKVPYGNDEVSQQAIEKIRVAFGKDVDVYFATTGSAINIIPLAGVMGAFEGVVCPDTAHINVDECGALERFAGVKILHVPHENGKLKKEKVKPFLASVDFEHHSQPRVISISQVTELGTVYSVEEIRELADFAHENNMYLHVDGARLANAVVAENSSFKEMITDTGVDLLSFGGSKNGMMMGEAVISFNKELSKNFKYHRKQAMQLVSKMWYMSAQFIPYLENDLWRENAKHANDLGQYLKEGLAKIPGIKLEEGLETNMIFGYMEDRISKGLEEKYGFSLLDKDAKLFRFVTSFNSKKEEVDQLLEAIKKI